jgi:hypothetical protein
MTNDTIGSYLKRHGHELTPAGKHTVAQLSEAAIALVGHAYFDFGLPGPGPNSAEDFPAYLVRERERMRRNVPELRLVSNDALDTALIVAIDTDGDE